MIHDKRDGPFRLEVDWIRADDAFSLDRFRWTRRPLVVFPEREDDARLKRQLDAVREARAAFDERDMELVVVAPGSGWRGASARRYASASTWARTTSRCCWSARTEA